MRPCDSRTSVRRTPSVRASRVVRDERSARPFARCFALDSGRAARHLRTDAQRKGAAEQPDVWPGVAGPRTGRARDKLAQTHLGTGAGVNIVRGARRSTCRVVSRASAPRAPRCPFWLLPNSVATLDSGASPPRVGLPESMRARNRRPAGCRAHARIEPKRCRSQSPRRWGLRLAGRLGRALELFD